MARLSELLGSSTWTSPVTAVWGDWHFKGNASLSKELLCSNPWYGNTILIKTDCSIWFFNGHGFSSVLKISVKLHIQLIRFQFDVDSWSCAFFMDICLDCISPLWAMQMECKYFGNSHWIMPFVCYFRVNWDFLNEVLNLLVVTSLTKRSRHFSTLRYLRFWD